MDHLSNEEFFVKLTELFEARKGKDHGKIILTQKRLSHGQTLPEASESILPDTHPPKPLPVIIRATNGKGKERRSEKIKLSTVVEADTLPTFFEKYAEVCKAGMTTLRPRDRSRRKLKGKKKKGGAAGA